MSTRRFRVDFLGNEATLDYSPRLVGYAIVGMRIALGWVFFHAGVARLLDPGWSVGQFVGSVPPSNLFVQQWSWLGTHAGWLLALLLTVGFAVVGAGLLFGAFLRASALVGAGLMGLTWTAALSLSTGVVTQHLVYVPVLFGLGALGAGRLAGLDALFENHPFVEEHPELRVLLG